MFNLRMKHISSREESRITTPHPRRWEFPRNVDTILRRNKGPHWWLWGTKVVTDGFSQNFQVNGT